MRRNLNFQIVDIRHRIGKVSSLKRSGVILKKFSQSFVIEKWGKKLCSINWISVLAWKPPDSEIYCSHCGSRKSLADKSLLELFHRSKASSFHSQVCKVLSFYRLTRRMLLHQSQFRIAIKKLFRYICECVHSDLRTILYNLSNRFESFRAGIWINYPEWEWIKALATMSASNSGEVCINHDHECVATNVALMETFAS